MSILNSIKASIAGKSKIDEANLILAGDIMQRIGYGMPKINNKGDVLMLEQMRFSNASIPETTSALASPVNLCNLISKIALHCFSDKLYLSIS